MHKFMRDDHQFWVDVFSAEETEPAMDKASAAESAQRVLLEEVVKSYLLADPKRMPALRDSEDCRISLSQLLFKYVFLESCWLVNNIVSFLLGQIHHALG